MSPFRPVPVADWSSAVAVWVRCSEIRPIGTHIMVCMSRASISVSVEVLLVNKVPRWGQLQVMGRRRDWGPFKTTNAPQELCCR